MPPAQRESLDHIVKHLHKVGAPAEVQELLLKIQKHGPGGLSIMEKGRLMRCCFEVIDECARLEAQEQSGEGAGKNGQAGQDSKSGSDQGRNDKKSGEQQQQSPDFWSYMKKRSSSMTMGEFLQQAGLGLAVFFLWNTLSTPFSEKEVTWQEVRRSYLDKGLVQKLVVVGGQRVRVQLHPNAGEANGGAPNNSRQTPVFSIGSVEHFEHQLEEAQNQLGIPPNERIPVSYEAGGSAIGNILMAFGPTLLFIGLIIWSQRSLSGRSGGGGMFQFGKSKAKKFNAESAVKVKFADVAGLEEAKVEIMEFVSFLKQPEKFEKLGAKIPRGAILAGPPGTGKTLLAKATAGESGVPFYSVSGSEFVEMFVGVGPSRVRDLFAEGRKNAPCIIFIDEIDAIGRARQDSGKGFGGNDEREATLNQILTEMDGFNTREQVVVLAGTNRADVLDKALMRPGRFDRHIYIDRPTMSGRKEIFKVYLRKIVTREDEEHLVGRLATLTPGFSGADISNVVNEAALIGKFQP